MASAESADPRTLALQEIGPKVGATAGAPVESAHVLYRDEHVQVGVWECTPGAFPSARDGISELMLFLGGTGAIRGPDGEETEIGEGRVVVLPDGWSGAWEIRDTVRKLFVVVSHGDGS